MGQRSKTHNALAHVRLTPQAHVDANAQCPTNHLLLPQARLLRFSAKQPCSVERAGCGVAQAQFRPPSWAATGGMCHRWPRERRVQEYRKGRRAQPCRSGDLKSFVLQMALPPRIRSVAA